MDVHLVGGTLTAGRVLPDAGRAPLPARVQIAEAAVAGDHLFPAHFRAAPILLHDAPPISLSAHQGHVAAAMLLPPRTSQAYEVVMRMVRMARSGPKMAATIFHAAKPFTLLNHKPLYSFTKFGFVLLFTTTDCS